MTPLRLYVDEHIGRGVIKGLRQRGIDVLTVVEAQLLGASDEDHLAVAYREDRIILTQDADFLRLHARGISHGGIIYAPQGTSIGAIVRGVLLIRDLLSTEDMRNHVEFL